MASNTPMLDYSRLLTDHLHANDTWRDMADAMTELFNPEVIAPTVELSRMRQPSVDTPLLAAYSVRMLGFRVPAQSFTAEEYDRLVRSLGLFNQTRGGSSQFSNLLSYIKNAWFQYEALWTEDFKSFWREPPRHKNYEIWNGGTWYPTTYFVVSYDIEEQPTLDENKFIGFIRQLSPIHLVFRGLNGTLRTYVDLFLQSWGVFESETIISVGSEELRGDLFIYPVLAEMNYREVYVSYFPPEGVDLPTAPQTKRLMANSSGIKANSSIPANSSTYIPRNQP